MKAPATSSVVRTMIVIGTALLTLTGGACTQQLGSGPTAPLLVAGEPVAAVSGAIPTEGGTITVGEASSAIRGLTIDVPTGAYSTPKEFTVSYRPIVSHALPGGGRPASPLITIDNGDEYADEIMTLTIPINAAHDQMVVAFLYDERGNTLEGLTVLDRDDTSVKVATRHFSDAVAVTFNMEELMHLTIDSGFLPGEDDWQFANNGSYLSPGGHCSGMNLTAMYYYLERRRNGHPRLWGRYDSYGLGTDKSTPGFTVDDDQGIKLCSIVQEQIHAETQWQIVKMLRWFMLPPTHDETQFYSTIAALKVTKEPQYLTIRTGGAYHALICFMVDDDRVYVADPNLPGGTGIIRFDYDHRKFDAARSTVAFDYLLYVGKTGVYNWSRIGEWLNRTDSGEVSMDANGFPDIKYKINELDSDDHVTGSTYFDIAAAGEYQVGSARVQVSVEVPAGFNKRVTAYRYASLPTRLDNPYVFTLTEGENLLGLHVEGFKEWEESGPTGTAVPKSAWLWAGFQWINLRYTSQPVDSGGGCTMQAAAGRWRRTYDHECDGIDDYTDGDSAVLILHSDGKVEQGDRGVQQGWGWGIRGERIDLWYPMDIDLSDTAVLTADCARMEEGSSVHYSVTGAVDYVTCWTAVRE